jgi:hypothetical protein
MTMTVDLRAPAEARVTGVVDASNGASSGAGEVVLTETGS